MSAALAVFLLAAPPVRAWNGEIARVNDGDTITVKNEAGEKIRAAKSQIA